MKKLLLVMCVLMVFCFSACNDKPDTQQQTIVGRWELKETQNMQSGSYFGKRFELFSDGTGISSAGYEERWIAENGRLKMGADATNYKLSGNQLILTEDDGSIGIYERK